MVRNPKKGDYFGFIFEWPETQNKRIILDFFSCMYFIQHCFICRPSDSTVSEDAAIRTRKPNNKISTPLQVCGVCQKSVRQDNYSAHMLLHQERQFRCDRCPARFTRRPELKRHMGAHSAEKLFECEVCSKGETFYSFIPLKKTESCFCVILKA